MRKWMLNLHLYAGLLCAPYLIIFGISSLNFNHHFIAPKQLGPPTTWEQTVPVPPTSDNLETAQAIRDSLGMIGWTPWWLMNRDATGNLNFEVSQPGKNYKIRFLAAEGRVVVEERSKSFLNILNVLHGMMTVPNSLIASAWGLYTDVCTWTVLFATCSGIYLWVKSARERRAGAWVLLIGMGASVALMIYLVAQG